VQQPVGKASGGFERMAEGVAEIEQRAVPGFSLVARNDAGFAATADSDGMLARVAGADKHMLPVGLEPAEEFRIPQQSEFHHLGIAGGEFALRQSVEQRGVGHHQHRLVKSADQVLALR
jgi:UDP-N-acetyl-D-mannosaminuronic acid transferase (WecB/TagA/CpsF family)